MVVPAGLVNNWHRELNEVFNLDFEVFGSEGDITDRKANTFASNTSFPAAPGFITCVAFCSELSVKNAPSI